MLFFGFFDEADDGIDDIGVDDVLYVVFGPVEGEEAHAFDGGVVGAVSACAVDDVGDLVEGEPLDILLGSWGTCAIIWSPMKIESVILTGIDTSSWFWLISFCCMGLISDCYFIKQDNSHNPYYFIRPSIPFTNTQTKLN